MNSDGEMMVLLEGSPYAHFLFGRDGRMILCNKVGRFYLQTNGRTLTAKEFWQKVGALAPNYITPQALITLIREKFESAIDQGESSFETELTVRGAVMEVVITFVRIIHKEAVHAAASVVNLSLLRQSRQELIIQGNLLKSINQVASILMMSEPDEFDRAVWESLQIVGRTVNADRAYIWENFLSEDGRPCSRQIYEWSEGVEPQQDKDFAQELPYDIVPYWWERIRNNRPINSPVRLLPQTERDILEPQGILSFLVIPIAMGNDVWGYIGFDDCRNERFFTTIEEQVLISGGTLMVSAITRNAAMRELEQQIIAAVKASNESAHKSNFLAHTSHEIRTPMNAIMGMAELALREELPPTVRSHIGDIKNAGMSLLTIINDILDFSKIESGKLDIVPMHYHMSSMLNDIVSVIRMRALTKGLLFLVDIDSRLPDEVHGDTVRIRQILINLLDNAVKYSEKGFVSLTVTGKAGDGRFDFRFRVADSGYGIRREDYDKLFQDFMQLDAQKNHGVIGTGLGLTISRNLARLMGGDITFASEYNKGSEFFFDLPQAYDGGRIVAQVHSPHDKALLLHMENDMVGESVLRACENLGIACVRVVGIDRLQTLVDGGRFSHLLVEDVLYSEYEAFYRRSAGTVAVMSFDNANRPRGTNVRKLPAPVHSGIIAQFLNDEREPDAPDLPETTFTMPDARILVVDDNQTNLRVAAGLLQLYEAKVDTCGSGYEAIELAARTRYDLIFMDHMMPGMDGVETTRRIRAKSGECKHLANVPIVALSANAISGMAEMFFSQGLDDFLSKPIDVSKLHQILAKHIAADKRVISERRSGDDDDDGPQLEIEGIDTSVGRQSAGGSWGNYRDLLRSYRDEGRVLLGRIELCLEEADLKNLSIYVHSLKSSSSMIGAGEIAKKAALLELAGQRLDHKFINEFTGALMNSLELLLDRITAALAAEAPKERPRFGHQLLKNKLEAIGKAVVNLDLSEADCLLGQLKAHAWPEEVQMQLEILEDELLISEFTKAEERISGLVKGMC